MLLRACIIALTLWGTTAQAADQAKVLRLFIWEDYFPESVIESFEATHGIRVEQVYYETDELKDETLINTNGGEGMDLMVGSRASFREYAKYGWLSRFPAEPPANMQNIEKRWLPKGELKGVSVPYLWGTVGIGYRKDKVPEPLTDWMDLFKPNDPLKQKIMMTNDSRDTIGLALKSLGYSINSTSKSELKEAESLLLAQKPYVKAYSYPELDESSQLVTGEIWACLLYNGDAIALKDLNENIDFVVPPSGTNLWVDDIAVLKKSTHQKDAWTFVNYINEPKVAASIAAHLYYATPNKAARLHLEKSFLEDKRIYPSQATLENSEFFKPLSAQQNKQRNDIFLKVLN